ncbi:MAG TPA: hypothetical protein ENN05_05610 [Deltaproteobacteria bacterium]|nr:hypothetical protein [Deltaproteobacteria bacterium]
MKKIEELIDVYPEKGKLPCPVCHFIAAFLNITPQEVGEAATHVNARIYQCQLGLFGYGRKGQSGYKILGREVEVPQEVLDMIKAGSADGKVSCTSLWEIADRTGILRVEAGNAADSLGLKIGPCQLGAFK